MAQLVSYGKEINSIFQLLGDKENDITLSMSWALNKCPEFLKKVVYAVAGIEVDPEAVTIKNQSYDAVTGITDIEVTDNETVHIIFEAKRGWILPGAEQLTKYSLRDDFVKSPATHKKIVTLSECSMDFANAYLPFKEINGISVSHLPWKSVYELAGQAHKDSHNHAEKRLLDELCEYLRGIMTMQNKDSNWVYVVSLGANTPDGCNLTWIQIVQKYNKYFCHVGKYGFPKEPPNYIAFRYAGQLQAIHHIEGYTVTKNVHEDIPEMPDEVWDTEHFVFELGTAIVPSKVVKTGNIYRNGRVWAMLDTLLTADTISEARDISSKR